MAAGITIETEKIPQFADDLESYAKQYLNYNDVVAKLNIDALTSLDVFSKQMVSQLQMLEPFGQGNPEPLFATKGLRLASPPRKVGAKGDHLQLAITDNKATVRCVGFGMGKLEKKLLERDFFSAAYQPQLNTYNGNTTVQLVLSDIQFD
jgi:single-stranded-DNA-specific exonuclease